MWFVGCTAKVELEVILFLQNVVFQELSKSLIDKNSIQKRIIQNFRGSWKISGKDHDYEEF